MTPTRRVIRKTKIVATLGPACSDVPTLVRMIEAGLDVARFNFSHGTHAEHRERVGQVREAAARAGVPVALMLDTKGAEIRTGPVADEPVELIKGATFRLFGTPRVGGAGGVSVSYPDLVRQIEPGRVILLNDGRLELMVESVEADAVVCRIVRGGALTTHRGINIPGQRIMVDGLDAVNQADLEFAIAHAMDYIAASFMQHPDDVMKMRAFLDARGGSIPIVAKIENAEGLKHLKEIVAAADGTMVARGDLGVELPPAAVPVVQKRIIRTTVSSGKPVITATQMLDSMERNPQPTRAEANDVANAVLDGTSAVMLSGETARGRYPVEAVGTMSELALGAEASLQEYGYLQQIDPHPTELVTDAIGQAAITMANRLSAAAIVTLTESGFTSRQIAKYRPQCPIVAVTASAVVVRRLAMNWGVMPTSYAGALTDDEKIATGITWAQDHGVVVSGDIVVVTAGISSEVGSTNMVRIVRVA